MKKYFNLLTATTLACTFSLLQAQPGPRGGMGGPSGPNFNASMTKLFGEHSAFSANMEVQAKDMTMPGQVAFSEGKSRFEMDMTKSTGPHMRPGMAEQMKAMGMDKTIRITRPDKKLSYSIFPGFEAYAETPLKDPSADTAPEKFKIETTELAKETVDGHPCVKNKVVVTDEKGAKHEATVWNATDLKNFPVKITQSDDGEEVTMVFKDVKLAKPDKAQFDPPSAYKRYDNQMSLMRDEMMKRMGGAGGFAPPPR